MADLTTNSIPRATGATQIDDGSLTDDGAGNLQAGNGIDLTLKGAPGADGTGTYGGKASLLGGLAGAGDNYGGPAYLTGGASGAGQGGAAYVQGGAGTLGGNAVIQGGSGSVSAGGAVHIVGGAGAGGFGGGVVSLQGGDSAGTLTNGGSILLQGGEAGPDGERGDIRIQVEALTPSAANAPGDVGAIRWDADYLYICVASNTWKRAAIATWP